MKKYSSHKHFHKVAPWKRIKISAPKEIARTKACLNGKPSSRVS